MQDYLFLFIGGKGHMESMAPEELQTTMTEWMAWIEDMSKAGTYKGGNPLESSGKTVAGMDKVVTDGPFAEAKEVINGYMIFSASHLDEAVAEAKNCPIYREGGRVEVRPIFATQEP